MSKTDKTRPWEIQGRDLTEEGYVSHACTKARGRRTSRGGKWRTSVDVSVSLESWRQHPVAELFFQIRFERERDGRMYFSVAKRHNTTTAKVMQRLQTVFEDVELHISQWTEPSRTVLVCKEGETCTRTLRYTGGERHLGGAARIECKFRRRRIRQRERAAIYQVLAEKAEDFDLLPIREDRRTVHWDLT